MRVPTCVLVWIVHVCTSCSEASGRVRLVHSSSGRPLAPALLAAYMHLLYTLSSSEEK